MLGLSHFKFLTPLTRRILNILGNRKVGCNFFTSCKNVTLPVEKL